MPNSSAVRVLIDKRTHSKGSDQMVMKAYYCKGLFLMKHVGQA